MLSRLTKTLFFCLALTAFHAMTMIPLSSAYAEEHATLSVGEASAAAAAVDATADAAAAHAAGSPGFPQLNVETYPSQIFWLFLSFIVLYALMSKIALPRVSEVVDARHDVNESNLSKAAAMQAEAETLKNGYTAAMEKAQNEAQDVLAAIEKDIAEKSAASAHAFSEKARIRIAAADQAVTKAKQNIMADMADVAADLAADITNKLSGAQISKADAKQTVTSLMKKEA